jgi:GntR family transcriptional regulator of vanillate catabolism
MKPVTSTTEVAELLRERILSGEIPPGSQLQQIPLSEELGVSRTPIREALTVLAKDGLVTYEPNRGYKVRSFSMEDVIAAFDVRARLESLACKVCAERGLEKAVLEALWACVAKGDELLAGGELVPSRLPAYREMNVVFHDTIIRNSRNPWIANFIHQAHNVPMASDRIILWNNYDIIKRSHDDHARMTQAISDRNSERADYLMREHIYFAGEVLRTHFDEIVDGRRMTAAGT